MVHNLIHLLESPFRKLKLHAEHLEARKQHMALGVELYDSMKMAMKDDSEPIAIVQTIENEIKEPFHACHEDISIMESQIPPFLPSFIKHRKEEFGIEIWPIVSSVEDELKVALAANRDKCNKNNSHSDCGNIVTTAKDIKRLFSE